MAKVSNILAYRIIQAALTWAPPSAPHVVLLQMGTLKRHWNIDWMLPALGFSGSKSLAPLFVLAAFWRLLNCGRGE